MWLGVGEDVCVQVVWPGSHAYGMESKVFKSSLWLRFLLVGNDELGFGQVF